MAITGAKRSALFPAVPAVAEAGVLNYDITTWWGIVAPAGTPEAIVTKLNTLINAAAAKEPMKGRLTSEGAEAYRATPGEFRSMLAIEFAMWKEVVKSGNIKLD
jgi:tripartite-type tricarboxylate transporter receptor subunit TctC